MAIEDSSCIVPLRSLHRGFDCVSPCLGGTCTAALGTMHRGVWDSTPWCLEPKGMIHSILSKVFIKIKNGTNVTAL